MRAHILTIILLFCAVVSFALSFILPNGYSLFCDIFAFILPTIAAIVEMTVSEREAKKMEAEIKKRAIWEHLSQKEYDRRKAEGSLEENTYYATTDE